MSQVGFLFSYLQSLNKTIRRQTFSWETVWGAEHGSLLSEHASRFQLIHLVGVLEKKQALVLSSAVLSNRAIKQSRSPVAAVKWG